jgi:DNA-binding MarR family transcriptional regulator
VVPPAPLPRPLSTLLSQVLVAYTVELDNQFELRFPHHTTDTDTDTDDNTSRSDPTPWLVSYFCWANVLQYVGPDGLSVAALREQARTTHLLLEGLRRWRYVRLLRAEGQSLTKPIPATALVRTTRHGRLAQEIWRALPTVIDERWRAQLGDDAVERLHHALATVFKELPIDPPAFLPVVSPTQNGKAEAAPLGAPGHQPDENGTTDLITLLAGVLHSFTLDFEAQSKLSLSIGANTLRVLSETPTRLRDLPRLTGVSKEGNAMCTGFLVRRACALSEPDPNATRGKVIRLTPKGVTARANAVRNLAATEEQWRATFGAPALNALRGALEPLVGDGTLASSPLAAGLQPAPATWRAKVPTPETLPHYPMVLHRGGFPDGS